MAKRTLPACAMSFWLSPWSPAFAQISLDGTFGRSGPLAGPVYQIAPDLGRQIGPNLFHSFKEFSLKAGESATFSGPKDVQNVLSRVTGGGGSLIDGAIRSDIAGANVYLLNPAGVVFGPNAKVDISGSLAVTTADYLKLGGGGRFDAVRPAESILTSAPVEAFGFLGPKVNPVKIDGSRLSMSEGKSFSLVAGEVEIKGGEIRAPGGTVNVLSVASAGEVGIPVARNLPPLTALESGRIELSDSAVIDVGGGSPVAIPNGLFAPNQRGLGQPIGAAGTAPISSGGGQVVIRAGRLLMDHGAVYQTTAALASGGGISVQLSQGLELNNESHLVTSAFGPGNGGSIQVQADSITLSDHSYLKTTTAAGTGRGGDTLVSARSVAVIGGSEYLNNSFGPGESGNLELKADQILLDGQSSRFENFVGTSTVGLGKAGNVIVDAGRIEILNHPNGQPVGLGSFTLGLKPAGDVKVKASEIHMDGRGAMGQILMDDPPTTEFTAIGSLGLDAKGGPSGSLKIEANKMQIAGYSIISAATYGVGNAGSVSVVADEIVLKNSSLVSSTGEGSIGNGGSVRVQTRQLDISHEGGIGARTSGTGDAGSVEVQAEDITLDFGSIYADARETSSGGAGQVKVEAERIQLLNSGNIQATSRSREPKDAGDVSVTAKEITIDWRGQESDFRTLRFGPTFRGTGIGSQSFGLGGGQGGNVTVTATERLQISGPKGTISASTETSGNGGEIKVNAGELRLEHGGNINSSSKGMGDSGNILIHAREPIRLSQGGAITTEAAASSAGGITVRSDQAIHLFGSKVTSEAGLDGGNILMSGSLVTLNKSQLNANARERSGGNITVAVDFLISSADSAITASSEKDVDGIISILGPAIDLSGSLLSLPGSLLGGEVALPEHCGKNLPGDLSSFLLVGRGGLPLEPGGWSPSLPAPPHPKKPLEHETR
ncbi:MAG: filamentous hemagglutinin N-terminal domain-containing protein [Verrucomicrobia bacterium]|nr:filamentous hemagglutinin N-terminal domain-containing protein [Verrucomicrobiota bacterium]